MSNVRSIAISYGTVLRPTPITLFEPAHTLACRIVQHLWNNWGKDEGGLRNGEIDLYSINIPLVEGLLLDTGLKVVWTTMWRNSYGQLFRNVSSPDTPQTRGTVRSVGPDPLMDGNVVRKPVPVQTEPSELAFKFAPDMKDLITPAASSLPPDSDAWAIHQGWACVTPLRACFGEPPGRDSGRTQSSLWQIKL